MTRSLRVVQIQNTVKQYADKWGLRQEFESSVNSEYSKTFADECRHDP